MVDIQAAESFNIATLAGSYGMDKDRMEGKKEMKCYDWFCCMKKIDKVSILKTILNK